MESTQYVGLDVHKKSIYAVVLDSKGSLLFEDQFGNEPRYLDRFLSKIDKDSPIALESSGSWEHVYDYIDDAGYNNIYVANPSRIGLIARSRKKTDKHDAEVLANLVRSNMLPLSYAPSKEIRQQRRLTRYRASLSRIQNTIKNRIHAILTREGISNPFSDLFTQQGIDFLRTLELDWADRVQMDNYLALLIHIENKKKHAESLIQEYVETCPYVKLLTSIPGVAAYSGLIISSEIGDIQRFNNSKQLVSYAGLNPSVSQSGERNWTGRISKQGNKHLRWILIQSSNIAVLKDSNLAKIYHRIKKRKGHNVAITAVARKMLTYIYSMLKNNIKYQQLQVYKKAS